MNANTMQRRAVVCLFFLLLVWRSSSVEFAFHTTTCSCCINNSRAALPNQYVRFTDARTQTQQEPSQRVHRADIDMHERIRLHVPLFPSQHQSGFLKLSSWLLCQPISKEMNIYRMNVGLLTSLPGKNKVPIVPSYDLTKIALVRCRCLYM